MAVRIRMMRMGKKKTPYYRLVVVDGRKPRDGYYLENVGTYDVLREGDGALKLKRERIIDWINMGAQVSDIVRNLLRSEKIFEEIANTKSKEKINTKAKKKKKNRKVKQNPLSERLKQKDIKKQELKIREKKREESAKRKAVELKKQQQDQKEKQTVTNPEAKTEDKTSSETKENSIDKTNETTAVVDKQETLLNQEKPGEQTKEADSK